MFELIYLFKYYTYILNMKKESLLRHRLFETTYGNDYPLEQLYVNIFEKLPSKYIDGKTYKKSIIDYFIKEKEFTVISKMMLNHRAFIRSMERQNFLVNEKKQIIIRTYDDYDNKNHLKFEILFSMDYGDLSAQIELSDIDGYFEKPKSSGVSLIKVQHGSLDIEDFDLPIPEIDLELNYGKKFVKIHEHIIDKLNKNNDKGIVLLHGEPGTGKTTYIKYLTSLISDKKILFVPPSMADSLSDPSTIPFFMEHRNSILIIEDAEKVIADREINGSSSAVSNILNLTDGILGDCLNIQIIATFNMKREKIDNALLRKGRLIAEHKFEKLDLLETNKLLKTLNKEFTSKQPMSLADIYNVEEELFKSEEEKNKIGFHIQN